MKRFQIMSKKPHLLTLIPYNPRIKIFSKKQKRHFLHIIKLQLCAKNQNNPMSRFWDLYRTNERTNQRRLNHKSQPLRGDQKVFKVKSTCFLTPWPPYCLIFVNFQLFLPYFQNATSEFDETWPKVRGYGLSSYGIILYAGKILDLEIIHLIPLRTIGLRKL